MFYFSFIKFENKDNLEETMKFCMCVCERRWYLLHWVFSSVHISAYAALQPACLSM